MGGYVTVMVTPANTRSRRRLFLREHREAKGISAPDMATWMGMERESLLRMEREPRRCNPEKQARFAAKLDIEPEELWSPPTGPQGPQAKIEELRKNFADLAEMIKKTDT
jgi:DNA-binding XRE family transcriptional regulator